MRIVAGEFRNRRLAGPTWKGLRPTSDKLRETLFNILAPRIAGARVLDAYAGTGAVGLEALSRGAAHATFVDADGRAVALIERNLAVPGVEGRYTIHCGDVGAVLLLEPQAPDSFFQWGFFLSILSRTEYVEGYVMEPTGERMLAEDPALRAEFDARLAEDPDFAADPRARLQWLYQRTPFFDPRWRLYPVAREESMAVGARSSERRFITR